MQTFFFFFFFFLSAAAAPAAAGVVAGCGASAVFADAGFSDICSTVEGREGPSTQEDGRCGRGRRALRSDCPSNDDSTVSRSGVEMTCSVHHASPC